MSKAQPAAVGRKCLQIRVGAPQKNFELGYKGEKKSDRILITIQDDGPGMDEMQMRLINEEMEAESDDPVLAYGN